jgi:hypothetical protein
MVNVDIIFIAPSKSEVKNKFQSQLCAEFISK